MKLKILIVALVVVGLSACTQKTCPTYAKSDVNTTANTVEKV
ncbi:MAG: hypothetical protein ACJA08_002250 [Cyclobacteriaceae bacterium]|jgi:hypothetical protein